MGKFQTYVKRANCLSKVRASAEPAAAWIACFYSHNCFNLFRLWRRTLAFLLTGRDVPRRRTYDMIFSEAKRRRENGAGNTKPSECVPLTPFMFESLTNFKKQNLLHFLLALCLDWELKRVTNYPNFMAYSTSALVSIVVRDDDLVETWFTAEQKQTVSSFAIQGLVLHIGFMKPIRQEFESMGPHALDAKWWTFISDSFTK